MIHKIKKILICFKIVLCRTQTQLYSTRYRWPCVAFQSGFFSWPRLAPSTWLWAVCSASSPASKTCSSRWLQRSCSARKCWLPSSATCSSSLGSVLWSDLRSQVINPLWPDSTDLSSFRWWQCAVLRSVCRCWRRKTNARRNLPQFIFVSWLLKIYIAVF